jgi:cell division protein FtsB
MTSRTIHIRRRPQPLPQIGQFSLAELRLRMRRFVRPGMWVLLLFYLGFHTFHGERGLYALVREEQRLDAATAALEKTRIDRQVLETRVNRLRDGSIDLDLLDEQMRRMLGVASQGEVVVVR